MLIKRQSLKLIVNKSTINLGEFRCYIGIRIVAKCCVVGIYGRSNCRKELYFSVLKMLFCCASSCRAAHESGIDLVI